MTRIETFVEQIKNDILGKRYELSFSFMSKEKIKSLNKKYRNKNEPTDILSFPLDKKTGEILICREIATQKSKNYNLSSKDYLLFLFIHGCLHLKGLDHGDEMEKKEKFYFEKFKY